MRKLASLCIPCALLLVCAGVEAQEKSRTFCDKADAKNKCTPPATDCTCVDDTLEVTFDGKTESNLKATVGMKVPVTVMMETVDAGVQGWSYGVTHDETILTLNMVTIDGTDAKAQFNQGFNATSMENIQRCTDPADTKCTARVDGGGFISAVVLSLIESAELMVKRNSLAISEYTVAKDAGAGTLIAVTDRLAKKNSPPAAINITIVGKSRSPVTIIDGFVTGEGGPPAEICDNKVDDDNDTKIDCADEDCKGDPACPTPTEDCDNKADDDGDTKIDCADEDCKADPACVEPGDCLDYAYYFGPAATDTTLAIGPATSYVITMRNKAASLGFQLGAKATKAGAATNWEFSGTLGTDANRLIELIISDDQANSQTPMTPNKATSDVGTVASIERGAAIKAFSADDFFAFDTAPGVGGPGFTVGYVTDLQGTKGHKIGATGEGTPCPVNEILKVNLGTVDGVPFGRGDADGNEKINVVDAILIIQIDVGNLPARFACDKILDANDDGTVTVTDAIPVLKWVFEKGAALPAPFRACATDPTADALTCTASNCQ
jgi:hypothetical protein